MAVTMVKLGHMGMIVHQGRMPVQMRVRLSNHSMVVPMLVMLAMHVSMIVLQFVMSMFVAVALPEEKKQTRRHQRRGQTFTRSPPLT